MDKAEYDPLFSNAGDTTLLVESVSSHSAFGFAELVRPREDGDIDLLAEISSFEAASDEDFRRFEESLD